MTLGVANLYGYPFTDFVENAESYLHARSFWMSTFVDTAGTEAAQWLPWMSDPLKDGHPIFSMVDASQSRGILVQQVVKTDDPFWFKCWVSKTSHGDESVLSYLGIETFISVPSRLLFNFLVSKWVVEKIDHEDMLALAERIRLEAQEDYLKLRAEANFWH